MDVVFHARAVRKRDRCRSGSAIGFRVGDQGTTDATSSRRKGTDMPEITNPRELFLHELGDILYVEQKLADEVLPKLIGEVTDEELRDALEGHLEETRGHVENVKQVFAELDELPKAEPCLGFEGLKKEHDKLKSETTPDLIDSVDLGAAARTENYEIAAYEGLRRMAKALGEDRAVDLLDTNLAEEKEALRLVEKIATRVSKESAKALA
jgi:ferritin-like metal-binding protein YciE